MLALLLYYLHCAMPSTSLNPPYRHPSLPAQSTTPRSPPKSARCSLSYRPSNTYLRLCCSSGMGVASSSSASFSSALRCSMLVTTRAPCFPRMSMMVDWGAAALPSTPACVRSGRKQNHA